MESLISALAGFVFIFFLVILAIYIGCAIFLNKFNKLVYGKGTPMCWIPFANIYLLGKLTVNKIVGWILIICIILSTEFTVTINGVSTQGTILPAGISLIVSTLYGIAVFVLFIYAIVKYNKLKKE